MTRPQLDAPIVPFTVRAWFRVRGAIGVFHEGEWTVSAVTAEDAQAIWLARYSERYELHHFSAITPEAGQ